MYVLPLFLTAGEDHLKLSHTPLALPLHLLCIPPSNQSPPLYKGTGQVRVNGHVPTRNDRYSNSCTYAETNLIRRLLPQSQYHFYLCDLSLWSIIITGYAKIVEKPVERQLVTCLGDVKSATSIFIFRSLLFYFPFVLCLLPSWSPVHKSFSRP